MSENPFQPPAEQSQKAVGVLSGDREDLKKVAVYQKGIMICILIYLLAVITQFLLPAEMRVFLQLAVLIVGIVGMVFVFLMSTQIYGVVLGIFLGLATLIPCIGLLVLLMVNGSATRILKENGIRVGLMGADMSQI